MRIILTSEAHPLFYFIAQSFLSPIGIIQCLYLLTYKDYKAINSFITSLVSSSFALCYIFVIPLFCLRYTFIMPSLCLRFVNGGRLSSQRRQIEFTT